jgi:3',5'-cyclic AMP phosphodiesterase CpdA
LGRGLLEGREEISGAMRQARLWAKRVVITLAAAAVAFMALSYAFLYLPVFRYPADGELPPPSIDRLAWPCLGCPALVQPGGILEVEVDLEREGDELRQAGEWKAVLHPAREELEPLSFDLEYAGESDGPSEHWPSESRGGEYERVHKVRFTLPPDIPPELYDLTVEFEAGGGRISESEPNCVGVVEDDDDSFVFLTLADIHVHGRGNSTLFHRQTDKGIAEDGDPLFFREALRQVNLIRPDFVLMLGDYIRGQRRVGDLLREYEEFREVLLELEVPAFLVPGNHDQYVNEIDGRRWYEENIGPTYYSFQVGDCFFACLNSYRWPREDRVVMNKILFMEPRKWQGSVDSAAMENDPGTFGGELAWLRDRLEEHRSSPLRVVALHHDPYTPDGKGYSFSNVRWGPFFVNAGGGEGRKALMELASVGRVDLVLGGHRHVDDVGKVTWRDGGGETVYACQTCVYFDEGGRDLKYPGYRLIRVVEGRVTDMGYLGDVHSFPFYDGSVLDGETDLERLERPALSVEEEVEPRGEGSVGWRLESLLGEKMELRGLVTALEGGFRSVEGGEVYRVVEHPALGGRVVVYVRTELEAGEPGKDPDSPGEPSVREVVLEP